MKRTTVELESSSTAHALYLRENPSRSRCRLRCHFIRSLVTVKAEHGSYVSKNFERPHYVRLNKRVFDTTGINIRDEVGDLVAFEHGKVIITLHFRRSKTQYLI